MFSGSPGRRSPSPQSAVRGKKRWSTITPSLGGHYTGCQTPSPAGHMWACQCGIAAAVGDDHEAAAGGSQPCTGTPLTTETWAKDRGGGGGGGAVPLWLVEPMYCRMGDARRAYRVMYRSCSSRPDSRLGLTLQTGRYGLQSPLASLGAHSQGASCSQIRQCTSKVPVVSRWMTAAGLQPVPGAPAHSPTSSSLFRSFSLPPQRGPLPDLLPSSGLQDDAPGRTLRRPGR